MPQCALVPTVPTSAAHRGDAWSVPRIRQVFAVTSTTSPPGTRPPSWSSSSRAKSTRKLAQQAPQLVQGLFGADMVPSLGLPTMSTATPAGYSGTPLPKKLGIQAGQRICAIGAPTPYRELVAPWPDGAVLAAKPDAETQLVHLFVTKRAVLQAQARHLRDTLQPDAVLWVSWPKKTAKVATEV